MAERELFPLVVASDHVPTGEDRWTAGGTARGLAEVIAERGGAWVATTTVPTARPGRADGLWYHPVLLDESEAADHRSHCESTLAPLQLSASRPARFVAEWRRAYRRVNARVAAAVAECAAPGAAVWVHDFHLQLVPALLRAARPDLRIGLFLHAPFAPLELFSRDPNRRQVLFGLLGADLIGFQHARSAANFLTVASELAGARHDGQTVHVDGRRTATRVLPAGVGARRIAALASSPRVRAAAAQTRAALGGPERVLLSVGGPDPVDGVARRLNAYARLLADGRLDAADTVLVHVSGYAEDRATPAEHAQIDGLVAQINGQYGRIGRPAIHYLRSALDFPEMVAVFLAADVLLDTPLHQGVSVVAKEFVATRTEGTGGLVLSEFTGAAAEFPEAHVVNPYDADALDQAIVTAALVGYRQPDAGMRAMHRRVRERDVHAWAGTFLDALDTAVRRHQPVLAGTPRT